VRPRAWLSRDSRFGCGTRLRGNQFSELGRDNCHRIVCRVQTGNGLEVAPDEPRLSPWPVEEPADWLALVNRPQSRAEKGALRRSVAKGRPFGERDVQGVDERGLGAGCDVSGARAAAEPEIGCGGE
jgi:hypothetical protein